MTNWFGFKPQPVPAAMLTVALGLGAALFGCDEKFGGSGSPDIVATPSSVSFGKINIGDSIDEMVKVQNNGDGILVITDIAMNLGDTEDYQLYWNTVDNAETAFVGIDSSGVNHFTFPFEVQKQTAFYLFVNYAPSDDTPESGKIVLTTNVAGKGDFEIPIGTASVAPEISVSPGAYDFGRVSPIPDGSDDPIPFVDVTVSNIGQLPLTIRALTLSGSQEFTPLVENRDPRRPDNEALVNDPDNDGEPGLSPDKSFVIKVQYNPTTQVILSIVTCGIWYLLGVAKACKMIQEAQQKAGRPNPEDKTNLIWILFAVNVFLGVPTMMAIPWVVQTEANKVWDPSLS